LIITALASIHHHVLPGNEIQNFELFIRIRVSVHCKYEEAEAMHRRALEGSEKMLGREHPHTLTSLNNLGSVLSKQGKYEEAEAMHRRALEGYEKVLGREHPHTLTSLNNLGSVLSRQGKYDEAEAMYQRAFKAREKC
jgi:Tfp pilus assembly protein PilF